MHYADDSAPGQNISQILSGRRFSGHAKGGYGYAFSNLVVGGELLILIENELLNPLTMMRDKSRIMNVDIS